MVYDRFTMLVNVWATTRFHPVFFIAAAIFLRRVKADFGEFLYI